MPRPILSVCLQRTGAVAFVLLAAGILAGCGGSEGQAAGGFQAGRRGGARGGGPTRPAIPVAVERVEVGTASSYYTSTATLEAESRAQILARTTGVVTKLLREEGDIVAAGENLLLLDDDEAQLRVEQAEANLGLARAEYERRAAMRDGGLLSAEEFEATENNLRVRESDLGLARVNLSHTRVRAPFDGRIVRRLVDLGAHVSPGTPLFEIMDVTPLLARLYIPARRMGFIAEGQEMEIRLDSTGELVHGVVSLVSPIVDPATGTVKVTAEIREYPPDTRPGDFVQVRIVTARHTGALLVPSPAIFEEQGDDILFVVEKGKARRRVVQTGFVDGDRTEITGGVVAGELVVVKGQRQLREGIGAEILEGPPDVVAAAAAARERREAARAERERSGESEDDRDAS